jgi:chloride channel protein, CIC family
MQRLIERLPERVRLLALTLCYGVAGGLVTVAFMLATNRLFAWLWHGLTTVGPAAFLIGSFLVITLTSLASGVLMARVCPAAAGSGIPQLKAAYWIDLGEVRLRAVLVKFVGGVLALAGGSSLGREGPSVFISGGLCSNLAGWLGIERRQRRHAAATGAAAGLAAAFNTPMAAISFVLEEILGDLGSRVLGSVMLASVAGAFVVYALVGRQPSFFMPAVDAPSWTMYAVVPVAAGLGAVVGMAFQRGALGLRLRLRSAGRVPEWLRPAGGAVVVWVIGGSVYLWSHHLGVFGLGYEDLSAALRDGIDWKLAVVLAVAKLVATVASYGSGGCGGIFSPTLFMGAMCGFFTAGLADLWLPLQPGDHFVLAAVGMSACFGAAVRAPVTSILMIFEMTHQFGMVPALMLGTAVSQVLARLGSRRNFYDEVLHQDGHDIRRIVPPRDLSAWRALPLRAFAARQPVAITDLAPARLRDVLARYPYRCFPVIVGNDVRGVVTRAEVERALRTGTPLDMEKPVVFQADQSLQEVDRQLIQSSSGLFLVSETEGGPPTGVFTLHDLLRVQAAALE